MPIVASHQSTPFVLPAVAPLHLPARLPSPMGLWEKSRPTSAMGPFPLGRRRLNPPASHFTPEVRPVIAIVSSQADRTFLGTALGSRNPRPVHHFQPHGDLGHVGRRHRICQGQAIAFGQQMDRAALALPAIGYILSPFLAGTKLPPKNAWLQSSLPIWSSPPGKFSQMCSHTPCTCHSWRRQRQVDRLPYWQIKSFQRAPERSTQRMPLRAHRSSAGGLPRRLCAGRSGSISAHWSPRDSSSIARPSLLRRRAQCTS